MNLALELDAWNAAIARSRDEYRRIPTRACGAFGCTDLRRDHPKYCPTHARHREEALTRMRARRQQKKASA